MRLGRGRPRLGGNGGGSKGALRKDKEVEEVRFYIYNIVVAKQIVVTIYRGDNVSLTQYYVMCIH